MNLWGSYRLSEVQTGAQFLEEGPPFDFVKNGACISPAIDRSPPQSEKVEEDKIYIVVRMIINRC